MKSKTVNYNKNYDLKVYENGFHLINRRTQKAVSCSEAGTSLSLVYPLALTVTERFKTKRSQEEVGYLRSTITTMGWVKP